VILEKVVPYCYKTNWTYLFKALPMAVICVTEVKFINKHAHMIIIYTLICALLFALH